MIASSPGGVVTVTPARFCSWSPRAIVVESGLNPRAWLLSVPALKDGANALPQPAPPTPEEIANESDGVASLAYGEDHGVKSVAVANTPHDAGVTSGALAPPKKSSFRASKGSCGVLSNTVRN